MTQSTEENFFRGSDLPRDEAVRLGYRYSKKRKALVKIASLDGIRYEIVVRKSSGGYNYWVSVGPRESPPWIFGRFEEGKLKGLVSRLERRMVELTPLFKRGLDSMQELLDALKLLQEFDLGGFTWGEENLHSAIEESLYESEVEGYSVVVGTVSRFRGQVSIFVDDLRMRRIRTLKISYLDRDLGVRRMTLTVLPDGALFDAVDWKVVDPDTIIFSDEELGEEELSAFPRIFGEILVGKESSELDIGRVLALAVQRTANVLEKDPRTVLLALKRKGLIECKVGSGDRLLLGVGPNLTSKLGTKELAALVGGSVLSMEDVDPRRRDDVKVEVFRRAVREGKVTVYDLDRKLISKLSYEERELLALKLLEWYLYMDPREAEYDEVGSLLRELMWYLNPDDLEGVWFGDVLPGNLYTLVMFMPENLAAALIGNPSLDEGILGAAYAVAKELGTEEEFLSKVPEDLKPMVIGSWAMRARGPS